jgi:hypothetical protein
MQTTSSGIEMKNLYAGSLPGCHINGWGAATCLCETKRSQDSCAQRDRPSIRVVWAESQLHIGLPEPIRLMAIPEKA